MRTTTPKSIGSAIESALGDLGLGKKVRQYEVVNRWQEIVGEQIARVTIAERLSDGKLFVSVSRSPWRNELVFLKKELIEKINKAMRQDIVKDIIFR
jgi:predicted nucleic acid-binding Zn ribbon protein